MEAIRFTNTSQDEIGIDDSSRYPLDEFLYEDDPSRQYQVDSNVLYYVIPHGCSLTKLTLENLVPEVIAPKEPDIHLTKDNEGMLTRSMAAKLTTASASECLFADFLSKVEPKKVSEALKHPGWVKQQEELNQFSRNKEHGLLVSLPMEKRICSQMSRMEPSEYSLSFATHKNFKFTNGNVKSAFLNGKLKEEFYVKQPPGFESNEFSNYVFKLDKTLYGLKQALRACLMCKISVQSKGITSKCYEKNPQVPKRKSTSNACQILGGKLVCWSAKKQQSVAMSSAKAEYVSAAECCASILWMKSQLSYYDIHYKMVPIFCDNTSAIAISNNPILHSRTKHIDITYHFIRDHILKGDI
ncbi:retrovirus-related pol polyprotein from transposon TNT 1-94 [Tanacetum coccineum]